MTGQTAEDGEADRPTEEGTRAEIMDATYEALRKHGYAELTIQTIADEFPKSKSLLYYHYDAKDDLLVDFVDWLVEEFAAEVGADPEFVAETLYSLATGTTVRRLTTDRDSATAHRALDDVIERLRA